MPKTCCSVQPSSGRTRLAASAGNFAPPTWSTSRDDRSCSVRARADSHASASGGTSEAIVTRSLSMSAKAVSGLGSGASTTVPPEWRTPRIPGELIGKLCAAGSTTSMRVRSSTPQMRAESRTE